MPEEIDLSIEDLRRVAEIAFQKRVSKLYDPVLREAKDLAEKFANEGIASAGKYQRKVADEVFAKFESIEAIVEEIYVDQLYAQNLPTDEHSWSAGEHWLRAKIAAVIDAEVVRAQQNTENLGSSFFGPFAKSGEAFKARVGGEGATMKQRLGDAITARTLLAKRMVKTAGAPEARSAKSVSGSVARIEGVPTAFISYSWDSEEHRRWVIALATRLREKGIDVVLDYWHLKLGADKTLFMEKAVRESDHVLLICTPKYKEKADGRLGGVGWEASIVTAELADDLTQTKFIPVLREGSFKATVPIWLKNRVGVDLSADPYSEDEFQLLLRDLHEAVVAPPPLGPAPAFNEEARATSHSTQSVSAPLGPFPAVEARDGSARFRGPGEPLGQFWNTLPFAQGPDHEVFLAKDPAIWLRVMPHTSTAREWINDELLRCGRQPNVPLQPLLWSNLQYLRAEDGMGAYATLSPTGMDTETSSVMFVFNTGEIWCVDTTVLQISGQRNLYFLDIARSLVQRLPGCAEFLKCLGIEPPFDWVAGLDGIKGWRLNVPPPPNHFNPFPGQTSLSNIAVAKGTFEPGQVPSLALRPFFAEIFKKCGTTIPAHIEDAIRGNRKF
jgi:hypothetical protein